MTTIKDTKEPSQVITGLLATVVAVTFYFIFIASSAFVAAKIWVWHFVVLGLEVYSWTTFAAGLLLIRLATLSFSFEKRNKESEPAKIGKILLGALSAPWLILIVAWWMR